MLEEIAMVTLNIQGTERTPSIHLNPSTGRLIITGRSLPENAATFYQPVITWIQEYAQAPHVSTVEFEFRFEYLDIDSSKLLLDIIAPLIKKQNFSVKWYCNKEHHSIKEWGENLCELLGISFEYKME